MVKRKFRSWAASFVAGTTLTWSSIALGQDTSMRIGTYNTRWICDALGISDYFTAEERIQFAQELCWRIYYSNYDVIALQETFDADAAHALGTCLQAVYPHQVVYLADDNSDSPDGSPGGSNGCDESLSSGLSLFSKHPFEPLSAAQRTGLNSHSKAIVKMNGAVVTTAKSKEFIGYQEFSDVNQGTCDDAPIFEVLGGEVDCAADKGLGFARVRHATTGRISNLLFTHLFAGGFSKEGGPNREANLKTVVDILNGWGWDITQLLGQDYYFMGDFNIDGVNQSSTGEWAKYFSTTAAPPPINNFFQTLFHDSWRFEGFNNDRGVTTHAWDQRRLDYIFRNTPGGAPTLCNSHMSRAFNLGLDQNGTMQPYAGGLGDQHADSGPYGSRGLAGPFNFSDHLGLNMELQPRLPHCAPMAPSAAKTLYADDRLGYRTVKGVTDGVTQDLTNRWIQSSLTGTGGRSEWSKISEPGWYVLGLWDQGTSRKGMIEVFREGDWSRRVRSYKSQVWRGTVGPSNYGGHLFMLHGNDEYYVRTRFRDPASVGDVWWTVKKLDCSNFWTNNVCPLEPNRFHSAIGMLANVDYGPEATNMAVFVIDVPPLIGLQSQKIKIGISGTASSLSNTTAHLYEATANGQPGTYLGVAPLTGGTGMARSCPAGGERCSLWELDVVGPKRYLLVPTRTNRTVTQKFWPFWSTEAVSMFGARRSPQQDSTADMREIVLEGTDLGDGGASQNDELKMKWLRIDGFDVIPSSIRLPYLADFEGANLVKGAATEYYPMDGLWAQWGIERLFFKNRVEIRWEELDSGANLGNDEVTQTVLASGIFPKDRFFLSTATSSEVQNDAISPRRRGAFCLENDCSGNSEYTLQYNLGRPWASDCYGSEPVGCVTQGYEFRENVIFP